MNNNSVFEMLENKGVSFVDGLTNNEILKVETRYNIVFPKQLADFLSQRLPVSDGFYNWRDLSPQNTVVIDEMIKKPAQNLVRYMEDIEWCNRWGDEPKSQEIKKIKLQSLISNAPALIPVFGHRYIASVENVESPVFSIHGTDIIYYGEDLYSYLDIEFGERRYNTLDYSKICPIKFWSDLI